jgi:hypothetical protein
MIAPDHGCPDRFDWLWGDPSRHPVHDDRLDADRRCLGLDCGGVKLATIAILLLTVLSTMRGRQETQAFGRRIATLLVFRSLAVISLFLVAHFILTLALAVSEDVVAHKDFGFLPMMFETMSAMATVGLSTRITPEGRPPARSSSAWAGMLASSAPSRPCMPFSAGINRHVIASRQRWSASANAPRHSELGHVYSLVMTHSQASAEQAST